MYRSSVHLGADFKYTDSRKRQSEFLKAAGKEIQALALIEAAVTAGQWALILAVAKGYEYTQISRKRAISIGAARAQMCRLRQQFAHLQP